MRLCDACRKNEGAPAFFKYPNPDKTDPRDFSYLVSHFDVCEPCAARIVESVKIGRLWEVKE